MKLKIMAGSGVDEKNASAFSLIKLDAVHFSIHNKDVKEYSTKYINEKKISAIMKKLS